MPNKNIKIIIIIACILALFYTFAEGISINALLNTIAIRIIFIGIIVATFISFSIETLFNTLKIIKKSFIEKIDYTDGMHKVHALAIKVKREGFLSIEQDIQYEQDEFLKDAMILLSDYKKEDVIRDILQKDIESRKSNLYKPHNVLKMIAYVAPSFGLIGTLVGMIGLLSNMDKPYLIMDNMAGALVSTLYGSIIASFIATPLMIRLRYYIDEKILQYNIIMEGMLLIAKNDSARNVFDKMNVMLKEEQRLAYPRKERAVEINEELRFKL